MSQGKRKIHDKQSMLGTLRDDIKRGMLPEEVKREYDELKEYILDEERREQIDKEPWGRRLFLIPWWFLKGMFFKLTPVRRLLVVIGVVLILNYSSNPNNHGAVLIGAALLLLVLMLELKDKLLAREELEAGRAVQMALMPEKSPDVPGWDVWLYTRSANEVGGDLVDFIRIGEARFGVALGDLSGKGLSAALLMAKLQATLQALVPDASSLAALGARLNRVFCRDCLPKAFASLVYMVFESGSPRVRMLNAGHIPPVVVRRGRVDEMAKGGPALGLVPKAVYIEQRLTLQPGDFMVVYTDGIVEAMNKRGEFFGDQSLFGLLHTLDGSLPAEEIGNRILQGVDRFALGAKAHDDLSAVVLRRKP